MGYTDDESMIRVDFFRPSGKWYTTEAIRWMGSYEKDLFEGFAKSLREHFKDNPNRLSEMDAICLDPYHKNTYPIQFKQGTWRTYNG